MNVRTLPPPGARPVRSDEISPALIFAILWNRKWLLLAAAVITLGGATAQIVRMPDTYAASVLLSTAASTLGDSEIGPLGSSARRLGGLASLAGLTVPPDTKKTEALAVLESRVLTEEYIRRNDLLPVLFPDEWDAVHRRWKAALPRGIPTLWEANRRFKGLRKVSTDPKSGLVTLTIRWKDPVTAAKWANGLVTLANDYLRSRAIGSAEQNIAYLDDQAAKTSLVESRQAIAALLELEIDKVMLARGSADYAFRVLDPAVPPERPTYTKPILILVGALAMLFALMLAVLFWAGRT